MLVGWAGVGDTFPSYWKPGQTYARYMYEASPAVTSLPGSPTSPTLLLRSRPLYSRIKGAQLSSLAHTTGSKNTRRLHEDVEELTKPFNIHTFSRPGSGTYSTRIRNINRIRIIF